MSVAIFASAFYPSVGGVEELVRQLSHEYRRQGISPIVLTNRWPRSLPRHEMHEGIPIYRLAMRLPEYTLRVRLNYWLTQPFIRAEMLGILRRHKTEVLHVQCVSSNGHYALAARDALGLPLIVTAQGERTMDANHVYEKSSCLNGVLRKLLRRADYVTACSKNTFDDLEQYYGERLGARGRVVYNGIRTEDFQTATPHPHPKPYIFAIGRLVPQKGFDLLIEAFANAGLPSHDLLIAGEGPARESLEAHIRKFGLESRARLIGQVDRAAAVALFKGCSFFVLPSRSEPFGIVNLEAMAAGKAIVASRVGGVPEIVKEGENGLLFANESVAELTAAMQRLGGSEDLRSALGKRGLEFVQDFTWPSIAAQYLEIYSRAGRRALVPGSLAAVPG